MDKYEKAYFFHDPINGYDIIFNAEKYIIKVRQDPKTGREIEIITEGEELDKLRSNLIQEGGIERRVNGKPELDERGRFNRRLNEGFVQEFQIPKRYIKKLMLGSRRYAKKIVDWTYEDLEIIDLDDEN